MSNIVLFNLEMLTRCPPFPLQLVPLNLLMQIDNIEDVGVLD